jgi:glucuronoarabinoxylan endo-1,4-beta-xylanase
MTRLFLLIGLWATPVWAQTSTVAFEMSNVQQNIDGFGVAGSQHPLPSAYADQLFTLQPGGLGLTFIRVGFDTDGPGPEGYNSDFYQFSDAVAASQRGAKVIVCPWSALPAYKTNSAWIGGHLGSTHFGDHATRLTTFLDDLHTRGVNAYAVELQNEPDFGTTDSSMLYTTGEMTTYLGSNLGPTLAARSPKPRVIFPSVATWSGAWAYATAALADGTAGPYVDLVSAHQYGGVDAYQGVRPVWQTEMSGTADVFDATITHGLTVAKWIHDALTTGGASAWFWWWGIGTGTDNEGLIGSSADTPPTYTYTKRLYTMAQYSRFIRPGWVRVGVSNSGVPANVSVSAFRANNDSGAAIVVINTSGSSVSLTVTMSGITFGTMTPYITSATQNLEQQGAATVAAGSFTYSVANNTVTTFVGTNAVKTRLRR